METISLEALEARARERRDRSLSEIGAAYVIEVTQSDVDPRVWFCFAVDSNDCLLVQVQGPGLGRDVKVEPWVVEESVERAAGAVTGPDRLRVLATHRVVLDKTLLEPAE